MLFTFNARLDARLSSSDIAPEARHALDSQRDKLAGAEVPDNLPPLAHDKLKEAIDESFVSGFRRVMLIAAALAILSALSAAFIIK
jgi:hypothetical protein